MFSKLLIAFRLKKKPQPEAPPRYAGHIPPRPIPAPSPPMRRYSNQAISMRQSALSPAPAPADDFASNMLLYSVLNSHSEPPEIKRVFTPEPGGGEFGGGGATGTWEAPAPAPSPSYEPPAPSPSYESSDSSSSSSD